jgi:outer membrane protein assembly factor BamA
MAKKFQYINCVIVLMFCVLCFSSSAQKNVLLTIIPVDRSNAFINELKLQTSFPSIAVCLQYVHQMSAQLASQGYISASVDSMKQDSSSVKIHLFIGEKYTWSNLQMNEDLWQVLNELGYKKDWLDAKPFDPQKVKVVYNQLLDYYASNGYPFSKIYLDSIQISKGLISAKLNVDKGFVYHIDSIRVYGNLKITQEFLHRYLDIPDHDIYNASKLNRINALLLALPYVQQTKQWDITMLGSGAIINLYLQPKHSNEINALIGFLPANEQVGGKLLLTGEVNLNLKNAFGFGENIGLNWQQLQPGSPKLNILFQRPYLFHSPFGVDFNFSLYKLDSSYLNINAQIALQYSLSAHQSWKVILQQASSSIIDVDTLEVIETKQLPPVADLNSTNLGVQYDFNNTNYPFNPRSGNVVQFFISGGQKNIKENSTILQIKDTSFNYAQLYDTIKLKTYQIRARLSATHYFPVGNQATVKTALNAGIYQSPSYFNNDLFQIGGYKLLRGFDEESIFANRYAVGTLEYHYLLGQNSYFFGFTDVGWAHYQSDSADFSHTYIGLGFGLAFETKTGIFNITYAIGKTDETNFSFQQSKIHLGFVTVF